MTVIEDATLCERVAVIATLFRGVAAKARQISAVPLCALVLTTNVHVRPAPETLFTVVFVPDLKSVVTNASSNSFPETVEIAGDATVALAVDRSVEAFASVTIAPQADSPTKSSGNNPRAAIGARLRRLTIPIMPVI